MNLITLDLCNKKLEILFIKDILFNKITNKCLEYFFLVLKVVVKLFIK